MKMMNLPKSAAAALLICAAFVLSACTGSTDPQPANPQSQAPQAARTQALPIAVQLYTLRSMASLEEQLKAVHDAGVGAVEIIGTHNVSADELNRLLAQYSIKVVSMHVGLDNLENDFDELLAFNKAIGNTTMVVPWLMPGDRPNEAAGWIALGQKLGAAAQRVEAAGFTLAYHNHDFEMVDIDGKTALELLFEAAGSALKAEIDVAWVAVANRDPVEFLNKLSGRVFSIHAKDKAGEGHPEAEQGLADVGAGVIDWTALLRAAHAAGVEWYIIEHDHPSDPATSIKNSAAFLTEHLPAAGVSAR